MRSDPSSVPATDAIHAQHLDVPVDRYVSHRALPGRHCRVLGGLDLKSQEASLRLQPDIVVATPGRLIDHIHNSPSFTLQNIEILVLDEADR